MNMTFATEEDMVIRLIKSLDDKKINLVNGDKRLIMTELNLGYGIADVVLAGHKARIPKRKHHLTYFDISLLCLIRNQPKGLNDIVKITKSPTHRILKSLNLLIEEEFIVLSGTLYCGQKEYTKFLVDSLAIEAKLHDWKRALKQAYRYKYFANKSYVCLPEDNIGPAEKSLSLFEKYNVGLAALSYSGVLKVLFQPSEEEPMIEKMRMALSEHLILKKTLA